jgi:hypothetical protein
MGIISLKETVRKVEKYDLINGTQNELHSLVQQLITTLLNVADALEQHENLS